MFAVDEMRMLTDDSIKISKGIEIRQPTLKEISRYGEKEYLSLVHSLTSEPFDMPYYLDQMGIDFEKITPFELFTLLVKDLPVSTTSILFGDLDFKKFKIIQRDMDFILANQEGIVIDSGIREIIADNLRRMHCLGKNQLTSCYNSFAHKLMIKKQKRDIEQARKKAEMFGEVSQLAPLISSLACEWHSYNAVIDLTISQFFDAILRSNYKETAESILASLRSGALSKGDFKKKDLDWRRPIKINPL